MDNLLEQDPKIAAWLDKFLTYHPHTMDMDLSRTLRLMRDMGDVHLRVPPVIHVAGTNGKGSTIAFLKAMAKAAGLRSHVMTSPHLVEFRERFVVADDMISNAILADYMGRIDAVNKGQSATFFELITAVGFQLFHDYPADICLLETGMGGRLDATNIIPRPHATIITMIAKDHMQFLGNTLPEIAFEKAGIMKADVPSVIGAQTDEALNAGVMNVFEARARDLNVPLYRHGFEWDYTITESGFDLYFKEEIIHCPLSCPRPNLMGVHQYANAAGAVMGMIVSGLVPDITRAVSGIAHAEWRARLQKFEGGALKDLTGSADEVWLDGGHNASAGEMLAAQISAWNLHDIKPTYLILGMLNRKDPAEFINPLKSVVKAIYTVEIPKQDLSFSAVELTNIVGGVAAESIPDAIQKICAGDKNPKRILITGSLYLAGHVLAINQI